MKMLRITTLLSIMGAWLTACGSLPGQVYMDKQGVAIHGYDPVAYFTAGQPTPGKAEFSHDHAGATWQFASARNKALFAKNPARYAPRYGGFCAYAMAKNSKAKIDPNAWKIVNGKLYLNYDAGIQRKWEKEEASMITAGDKNWAAMQAREQ